MTPWLYDLSRRLLRAAFTVLWRFRAEGVEHVPARGPTVLVANHASFFDPPLVGLALRRRCRFLARSTLAKIPLLGWWMQRVGVLLVDREAPGPAVMRELIALLRAGEMTTVFPEGTRTRTGELGPFRPGLLVLLKKTGAVVVPAGIRGSFAAFPPGRRLPRLFCRCSVTYGAAMTAEEILANGGLEALRHRVAKLSGQTLAACEGEMSRASDDEGSAAGCAPRATSAKAGGGARST
jgi:1-acyl-sn-glycerol-3-phosphate acyltransferase